VSPLDPGHAQLTPELKKLPLEIESGSKKYAIELSSQSSLLEANLGLLPLRSAAHDSVIPRQACLPLPGFLEPIES
jgi:hypothetical protein